MIPLFFEINKGFFIWIKLSDNLLKNEKTFDIISCTLFRI